MAAVGLRARVTLHLGRTDGMNGRLSSIHSRVLLEGTLDGAHMAQVSIGGQLLHIQHVSVCQYDARCTSWWVNVGLWCIQVYVFISCASSGALAAVPPRSNVHSYLPF